MQLHVYEIAEVLNTVLPVGAYSRKENLYNNEIPFKQVFPIYY